MTSFLESLTSHCVAEVEGGGAAAWWSRARKRYTELSEFDSIADLRRFFAVRTRCREHMAARERFVRALFSEYRTAEVSLAFELLFVLYRPLLGRVRYELRRSTWRAVLELDDIDSELVQTFLHLIATLDLETNRDVHTSLCRRLRGRCFDWARREFEARTNIEASVDDEPPQGKRSGWELDLAERALDELLDRRVIAPPTHALLVGVVVYGLQVKQLVRVPANNNGPPCGYEAAKKRRQRGATTIREYMDAEEITLVELARSRFEKIANSNVPSSRDPGSSKGKE